MHLYKLCQKYAHYVAIGIVVLASIIIMYRAETAVQVQVRPDVPNAQVQETTTDTPESAPETEVVPGDANYSLQVTNAQALLQSKSYAALKQAVSDFEGAGYSCSFMLYDLTLGQSVGYREHELFYPASSIKGPYILSLYDNYQADTQKLADIAPLAAAAIIDSDNDAFRSLHAAYGWQTFANWAEEAGVEDAKNIDLSTLNYPHVSAYDMAQMWKRGYNFLSSDTAAKTGLLSYFDEREVSPMREVLDTECITKAGWFYDYADFDSAPTAAEAGIVFSEQGNYAFALLTTAPGDLESIKPLLEALDNLHNDMMTSAAAA